MKQITFTILSFLICISCMSQDSAKTILYRLNHMMPVCGLVEHRAAKMDTQVLTILDRLNGVALGIPPKPNSVSILGRLNSPMNCPIHPMSIKIDTVPLGIRCYAGPLTLFSDNQSKAFVITMTKETFVSDSLGDVAVRDSSGHWRIIDAARALEIMYKFLILERVNRDLSGNVVMANTNCFPSKKRLRKHKRKKI